MACRLPALRAAMPKFGRTATPWESVTTVFPAGCCNFQERPLTLWQTLQDDIDVTYLSEEWQKSRAMLFSSIFAEDMWSAERPTAR